ncbi:Bacteriohemerythrin [Pseudomonas sp. OF001]|uniref:bacteriohemerythrin n=1 Tax=Pseudomonas sp. OF001 TaxID=2772300 RepID=UPI00191A96AD|nr:bacteriohemerythrin [Pseudomonas sp. OF001]CAD5377413.1 Bacteriohemerythrin [Pseudomonas sp. OF001]
MWRIVEYINDLHQAIDRQSRAEVGEVLEQLVEYTMSHFAFEEDLQEQAGYPFHHAHKKVHELFCRKIEDFQYRFELGEDVSRHLLTTLRAWLINHIKRDDADYAETVKVALAASLKPRPKSFFARLFG